jgi:immune inhibitor A
VKALPKALLAALFLATALNFVAAFIPRANSPLPDTTTVALAYPSLDVAGRQLSTLSPAALATRQLLETAVAPPRDEADLTRRFQYACGTPAPLPVPTHREDHEGDARNFWILDEPSRTFYQVPATLHYVSAHLLFYVQDGISLNRDSLAASARTFESQVYPTLREYFADPPYEPQITVFNGRIKGLAGYFSSSDLLPKDVNPFSNERPMVYMGIDSYRPGTFTYDSVLAHEVQHFLHHLIHPQQDSWVNEGASEMAMALLGDDRRFRAEAYLNRPETQLNKWTDNLRDVMPHYGGGYLILEYFAQRTGGHGEIKHLIASPGTSVRTFDNYFTQRGSPLRFDDLFADFVLANLLNDRSIGDGRYGYEHLQSRARIQETHTAYPARTEALIRPYSARYTEFQPGSQPGDLVLRFTGAAEGKLYAGSPPSGLKQWWGNAVDNAESTLTRQFDLTEVESATLRFNAWFDTERSYDYAGVAVSTDDGCTWQTLAGSYTTDDNPTGQNPGHAFNGRSGGEDEPVWVAESMDLSPYAGQKVQVRFFYITDQSYHGPGIAVDDISIPEIGFHDDAELDLGWEMSGFIHSTNAAALHWAVQAVVFTDGIPQIKQLEVRPPAGGGVAEGTLTIPGFGGSAKRVVVAVSKMVPVTLEPAEFRLEASIRH